MSDKPTTYSALKFDKGMTPKVFTPNSATRIEHFDTITEVLRPFRTLELCVTNGLGGDAVSVLALTKFAPISGVIYALGLDDVTQTYPAIYNWDSGGRDWRTKLTFGVGRTALPVLHAHAGALFGITTTGYIWKMTTAGSYTDQFTASIGSASTVADPITHSKDGVAYFPYNNKIWKLTSAGADGGSALILPNSNFRITSISEQGNYINIVGFDTVTRKSSSLLWDRDTSVVDLTESLELGVEQVWHNATLLGNTFFVQVRDNSDNTSNFIELPVIIIKVLNGNVATTLYEFPVASYATGGGKYVSNDRLYFNALVKFVGESTARNLVFSLDYTGKLTIAQNASIDAGTVAMTGLYREGEGFWLGAGADGAWFTTSTYTTVASYETNDIRSDDISHNISFAESYIMTEPLPASSSVVLKARCNAETSFTTLATYSTTGMIKMGLDSSAVNALTSLNGARQVRLRLESTGGAVITAFQAIFTSKKDTKNG